MPAVARLVRISHNGAMSDVIRINPGAVVVAAFGGVKATARALGTEHAKVSRWQSSGRIPSWWQERILRAAWERGVDLTAHDLVVGR